MNRVTPSLARASRALAAPRSSTAAFSTTRLLRGGDAHGDHYDPPTGWLFGLKPGEEYKKEGWEGLWFYGFFGSILVGAVGYAYKPDTSYVNYFLKESESRVVGNGRLSFFFWHILQSGAVEGRLFNSAPDARQKWRAQVAN